MEKGEREVRKHETPKELSVALAQRETNPVKLVERALADAARSPSAFVSLRTKAVLEEAEQSNARWREGVGEV